MDKIIAFDVETPNYRNNRICSIGLTIIENGEILDTQYYLINPECEFDYRNTQIHGISSEDVTDAPTFPEVWDIIGGLFRSCLVSFHSGSNFDLCVLQKTLFAYGINESLVYFVDTVTISRAMIRDTENHNLTTLCERFSIDLEHHNAGSDSYACAKLLCCLIEAGANLDRFTKSFQLKMSSISNQKYTTKRLSTNSQSLLMLNGILSGITCDNILVEAEVNYLQNWLDDNAELQGNYPYDKIYATLSNALADGILTNSELNYMLNLFKQVTNPVDESSCNCNRLDINGKNICLSGEFDYGSKAEVNSLLISRGAYIHDTIVQKTDILVVGGQGSTAWSAGNYGNKVKKALEMQGKGSGILLFREADFITAIDG
jgi:DNA polymerase III epsilon subunit-like protein